LSAKRSLKKHILPDPFSAGSRSTGKSGVSLLRKKREDLKSLLAIF
jgi:hypothetical protein